MDKPTKTKKTCERIAMTRKSFAERWELSERHVNKLAYDGVIPVIKLGRRCSRIPIAEADAALMAFMKGGKTK